MTTTLVAPAMAGAVFAGPRRSAQTALAAAVAASVLLHLAALAIRPSSGSRGAHETVAARPLAVRLITAAAAVPPMTGRAEPVVREPGPTAARPVSEAREAAGAATARPAVTRPSQTARAVTSAKQPMADTSSPRTLAEPRPPNEVPLAPSPPLAASTQAYRPAAGLDPPPRPLDDIEPEFPAGAGMRGGSVVLRLLLSETGAIDRIEVVRSNPPGLFEAAALAAFGAARFAPGFLAGTPVRSQIMFEVEFAPQARDGGVSSRGY